MRLHEYFARGYVINLRERTDRRREIERELARLALPSGWAEFLAAERPDSAAGFPSAGVRGCFLSHLAVLKDAHARGLPNVLVMEDDLTLSPQLTGAPNPIF